MDKLKMAHDYFMKHVNTDQYRHLDDEDLILWSFDYVDAMQAEAEKRKPSGLPNVLCEVDWRVAPSWAKYWALHDGVAEWFSHKPAESKYGWGCETLSENVENAPSFGFTGSHIVERPHGF